MSGGCADAGSGRSEPAGAAPHSGQAPDEALLRRIEDASINASAPPQQLWIDGWLVRFSPGKAKRARCVHAVAPGFLPLEDRLRQCERVFRDAGLPLFVRLTPFSQPGGLDEQLAALGWRQVDDTAVMVMPAINPAALGEPGAPAGIEEAWVSHTDYAAAVGRLRGSPVSQIAAHAQRLAASPVPYRGLVWSRNGEVAACGQFARERDLVGLYDVFTAPQARGQGFARHLCASLLQAAHSDGALTAYLQVEKGNDPAVAAYRRLGFAEGYRYSYRTPDASAY